MENYVINLRRELHENAECGFDLPKTLTILKRELDGIGVEYTEKYGKSSIVATVNPEKSHFTIGVRADIDALPISEKTELPFKSKTDGIMHACGHDAHTAIAVATLREIYMMREKIDCRVKFIFQAAEEFEPSGAKLMVEDGVMQDIDCIVALHTDTDFPAGTIGLIPGYASAASDGRVIEFYGKNAHAALQHEGVDAIMMAVKAYTEIEFAIAKEISAREPIIFNVGSFHGGKVNNIICSECSMYFTLRTFVDETREKVLNKIDRICKSIAETSGGDYRIIPKKHYPMVYNNEKMHELVKRAAAKVVGEENLADKKRGLGGEDFAYFANEKPGYMFRLGIKNEEMGITHTAHTDKFDIDESAMKYGVAVFVNFILDNMGGIDF